MKDEQHFKMEKEGRGSPGFGRKSSAIQQHICNTIQGTKGRDSMESTGETSGWRGMKPRRLALPAVLADLPQ